MTSLSIGHTYKHMQNDAAAGMGTMGTKRVVNIEKLTETHKASHKCYTVYSYQSKNLKQSLEYQISVSERIIMCIIGYWHPAPFIWNSQLPAIKGCVLQIPLNALI